MQVRSHNLGHDPQRKGSRRGKHRAPIFTSASCTRPPLNYTTGMHALTVSPFASPGTVRVVCQLLQQCESHVYISLFIRCLHSHMHSPFSKPLTLSSHSGACPFGASATRTAAIRLKHCVMVVTLCSPRKSAPARSFARRIGRKASCAAIYPERNRMGGARTS
jgi:hypothetical protein